MSAGCMFVTLNNLPSHTCTHSTLAAKMDRVKELQNHLDSCFHETRFKDTSSRPPSNNTTTCYVLGGDRRREEEEEGKPYTPGRPPHVPSSNSKVPTAEQKLEQLQAELEETRQLNESLQARLDQGTQMRDTGVGGGEGVASVPTPQSHRYHGTLSFAPEKYLELKREVDRLLIALESEREQFRRAKGAQQHEFSRLQSRVREAEAQAVALENQLRMHNLKTVQTDDSRVELESLHQEVEQQQEEIGHLKGAIAALRNRAEAERAENLHLQRELSSLKVHKRNAATQAADKTTLISSSLPDLSDSAQLSSRSMTDSWTSPPRPSTVGDPLDVSTLIAKHEEIVRLNHELQRKCCERLSNSQADSALGQPKAGSSERSYRVETTLKREQAHSAQVDEMEGKLLKLESELREKEATLRRQIRELDARLKDTLNNNDILRSRLAESLGKAREKDEELRK